MKPNLLKFANEVLLSTRPVSYNVVTGEMLPDDGFMVPHEVETYSAVDKDTIREFYNRHREVLVRYSLWLCIWKGWGENEGKFEYAVVELLPNRSDAVNKAINRGASFIIDNKDGDVLYRAMGFE